MLEMGSFKDDFKLPKYTGKKKKKTKQKKKKKKKRKNKGPNVDPAISGTFPNIRKLIQVHSICKFCTFEV